MRQRGPAAKPLVVNMSLSATSRIWHGRTSSERKLDAVVWAHRQLYVVANSNASISGFSNYGAAKNSLSVGAVYDNGELVGFSSWGPTFDGRLAPQLVATGVNVYSARGQGSRGSYDAFSGTSMASPSVAGVAALLMDAVADYREQPALTRAHLMASAIKPDAWLDAGGVFPADNSEGPGVLQAQFGLGKASARTSVLQRKRADGWENGAATSTLTGGSYGFQDIVVPEGASRLDLVLAWDEPPADTIGSTVLNDLDLWLDKDADCDTAACGEYASTSRRRQCRVDHRPESSSRPVPGARGATSRLHRRPSRRAGMDDHPRRRHAESSRRRGRAAAHGRSAIPRDAHAVGGCLRGGWRGDFRIRLPHGRRRRMHPGHPSAAGNGGGRRRAIPAGVAERRLRNGRGSGRGENGSESNSMWTSAPNGPRGCTSRPAPGTRTPPSPRLHSPPPTVSAGNRRPRRRRRRTTISPTLRHSTAQLGASRQTCWPPLSRQASRRRKEPASPLRAPSGTGGPRRRKGP